MGIWVIVFICHIWDMGCLNPLGVLSVKDSECIPGGCEVCVGICRVSESPGGVWGRYWGGRMGLQGKENHSEAVNVVTGPLWWC